ncbi:bifunctional 5,10-methylenetetrahydrofolate dehydrogenase/5,10-methenyltetrahydrofolate cyclohydrolase [Actinophytocola sp.]|uniref:bifunctional 5,10-methylenetetrahydrofolate dehydrogenase/5,10-methenyltetrahydrofolate cyclohydrolase n=1 Tax=Actinophytocola sp. TaxID=1872138 RepID=UPI002D61AC46|nr:bifunctional 5,10-methylenetetrahydrofolate dehydrogenase/5,10-methenyltetrahydrofolate cyclohydrolase [Actinophytocola sp.]HYQ69641.1 bifunctional 5,10-methylenetetrahydrofolate dehydrogenase/5,10-methenyltetrahydrofolate cyclohydrolase [Actinophytocola sp.]
MNARILDGRAVAAATLERVRDEVTRFADAHGRPPVLATVLAGDDPASHPHVRTRTGRGAAVGVTTRRVDLPASASTVDVVARVRELSADPDVDGILVQHPLPAHVDERTVFEAIDPAKDVDGVTHASFGALASGTPGFTSATAGGILALLDAYEVRLAYRQAVVIGRGPVGRPTGMLLLARDATVTYCHSRTIDLAAHVAEADVVVAAVGRPGLVRGKWVKQGAVVVDAGHLDDTGDAGDTGDVEYAVAAERASLITPVPGGVGPMTVATLLAQTARAARERTP